MLTRLRFRGKTGRRKRGIALLIVLLVTAILSVVVLDFAHSTRINLYIASNIADGLKAYYLAKSGLQVAQGALLDDVQKKRKVDHLGEDWNSPLFSYIPLSDNETISVTVTDESSKFNLNQLVGRSGTPRRFEGDWFRNLLALQQIDDPDVVAAIIDWLDSDEEVLGGGGMEDQVYGYSSAQPQAYKSRNGRLLTLAELRLVKGVTDEIYRKLTETCTIFADRKLNMNTIDQRVLQAMIMALDEKADAAGEAQKIVSWRVAGQEEAGKEEQIFDGSGVVSELEAAGVDRNLARKINRKVGVTTRYFSVDATAIVNSTIKNVTGVIQRSTRRARLIYFRPGERVTPMPATPSGEELEQLNAAAVAGGLNLGGGE